MGSNPITTVLCSFNSMNFKLVSKFSPSGDQPQAINELSLRLNSGVKHQVLLGATGTGKTYTISNVIEKFNKPVLCIAHNKTLAAQLAEEFMQFFPKNRVGYFISYYDYYRPEAYIPRTDTYIEKESQVNEEIEKYRNIATSSLLSQRDCIIVASVSCIYGLGDPEDYSNLAIDIELDKEYKRKRLFNDLKICQYLRNDIDFTRGTFRVIGETIDIFPSYEEKIYKIVFFGDTIEKILISNPLTGEVLATPKKVKIFPSKHFAMPQEKVLSAIPKIEEQLKEQVQKFKREDKLIEAQRIEERTNYDIELMRETGYCSGIENYSSIIEGREVGSSPSTLIDYFPDDFLLIIDESHITIPQIRAMYRGDRQRKETLVRFGFRLPSALDNRPLMFDEFNERINKCIYMSATPNEYELNLAEDSLKEAMIDYPKDKVYTEQIIRPTGILDPVIEVRSSDNEVKDLLKEIQFTIQKNERVLVTTLTKRMSEDLASHILGLGIKCTYIHSEVETIKRNEILNDLRLGEYDVVIGINLLREGLDLPEVSLVAILDADKEGFLRSKTSLIQTTGRAARHINGRVIMYANRITDSMKYCIEETKRRREIQEKWNHNNNIIPQSVRKEISSQLSLQSKKETANETDINKNLEELEEKMLSYARSQQFEKAIELRDTIASIKKKKKK